LAPVFITIEIQAPPAKTGSRTGLPPIQTNTHSPDFQPRLPQIYVVVSFIRIALIIHTQTRSIQISHTELVRIDRTAVEASSLSINEIIKLKQ